jgi:hypothetical protein
MSPQFTSMISKAIPFKPARKDEEKYSSQYIGKGIEGMAKGFNVFQRNDNTAFLVLFDVTCPIPMRHLEIIGK